MFLHLVLFFVVLRTFYRHKQTVFSGSGKHNKYFVLFCKEAALIKYINNQLGLKLCSSPGSAFAS